MKVWSILLCCLVLAAAAAPALGQMGWCWGLDYFRTSVASGVISITHENALYNCCPDRFDYAIDVEGTLISVVETEVLSVPCACLCCYSLPVNVGPIAPGQYRIDFEWHDYEAGPRHAYLDVEVPEWKWIGEPLSRETRIDPPPCQNEPPAASVPDLHGDGSLLSGPALTACYPNPAQQAVTIGFELPEAGAVRLAIFGAGGNQVRSLLDGQAQAGPNTISWDGRDEAGAMVAPGVYWCRLGGEGGMSQRALVLIH